MLNLFLSAPPIYQRFGTTAHKAIKARPIQIGFQSLLDSIKDTNKKLELYLDKQIAIMALYLRNLIVLLVFFATYQEVKTTYVSGYGASCQHVLCGRACLPGGLVKCSGPKWAQQKLYQENFISNEDGRHQRVIFT